MNHTIEFLDIFMGPENRNLKLEQTSGIMGHFAGWGTSPTGGLSGAGTPPVRRGAGEATSPDRHDRFVDWCHTVARWPHLTVRVLLCC